MACFAKFRRKLTTKNFEAHFHRKLRTLEKWSKSKEQLCLNPFLMVLIKKTFERDSFAFHSRVEKAEFWVTDILQFYSKMEIYMLLSFSYSR